MRGLRELELRKAPTISETIDWARTLAVLGVEELDGAVLSDTASVVVKYDKDVRKAIGALPRLMDPNARVPEQATATGTATATVTATTTRTTSRPTRAGATTRSTAGRCARPRTPPAGTGDYYGAPAADDDRRPAAGRPSGAAQLRRRPRPQARAVSARRPERREHG